jgi:hypothetical protein
MHKTAAWRRPARFSGGTARSRAAQNDAAPAFLGVRWNRRSVASAQSCRSVRVAVAAAVWFGTRFRCSTDGAGGASARNASQRSSNRSRKARCRRVRPDHTDRVSDPIRSTRHVMVYGPPAAGKLTVASALADAAGYRLLDNHLTDDLALRLFERGTQPHAQLVTTLRLTLFRAAAASCAPGASLKGALLQNGVPTTPAHAERRDRTTRFRMM